MSDRISLGDWIRRAYRGERSCPPAGAFLAEELASLDPGARTRLEEHAESCVACAAERDLARAFEASEPRSEGERRSVDSIVRRLERRPAHSGKGGWLSRLPVWGTLVRSPALQLAAALVVVVGVGVGIRSALVPPPLAGVPGSGVTRSAALELVAPTGELGAIPAELSWEGVDGASRYAVTLLGVDGSMLWRAETGATALPVDDALAALLRPAVSYVWRVEALDADGARIAWSRDGRFRIRPARDAAP